MTENNPIVNQTRSIDLTDRRLAALEDRLRLVEQKAMPHPGPVTLEDD